MKPFILAIIPARSGSKGVAQKNLQKVAGRSLLARSIACAVDSGVMSQIVASVDSEELAAEAKRSGAEVPFLRPAALASDSAPTLDVVQHAVKSVEMQSGVHVDIVVLLQPTTPFRSAESVRQSVELFLKNPERDSLISVTSADFHHPYIMYKKTGEAQITPLFPEFAIGKRRQEFDPIFIRSGAIYITRRKLLDSGTLVGTDPLPFELPRLQSINIDDPLDLEMSQAIGSQLKL